jgi:hypothetical protein
VWRCSLGIRNSFHSRRYLWHYVSIDCMTLCFNWLYDTMFQPTVWHYVSIDLWHYVSIESMTLFQSNLWHCFNRLYDTMFQSTLWHYISVDSMTLYFSRLYDTMFQSNLWHYVSIESMTLCFNRIYDTMFQSTLWHYVSVDSMPGEQPVKWVKEIFSCGKLTHTHTHTHTHIYIYIYIWSRYVCSFVPKLMLHGSLLFERSVPSQKIYFHCKTHLVSVT